MVMDNSKTLYNSPNLKETKVQLDYLKELLTDRNILNAHPRNYNHLGAILEKEILRIRSSLFSTYGINAITDRDLPVPEGAKVSVQEKVYMPSDSTNSFNFVGRILGPDGSTAKCLQQCLGVKIMVRGRGSMRDRRTEDSNVGKPNWEHLNDRLHVVLTVEDYENRAKARLAKACDYITLFFKESMKGSDKDDKVKQMQLMELSFRRESCPPWHFNCNNVFDLAIPQKSAPLYSNTTAPYNFGYSYHPVPSLFSPLGQNPSLPTASLPSHHHHHHFGQFGHSVQHPQAQAFTGSSMAGQQQHQQQQQQQQNGLTDFSYPFGPNLNAATFYLGHGPAAANYACQFSPTAHPPQSGAASLSSLPPGLTLNPISYWSGQNMASLAADFRVGSSQLTTPQTCVSFDGLRITDDTVPASSLLNNSSSSQSSNGLLPIGSNGAPLSVTPTYNDDAISPYLLSDLGACSLSGGTDSTALTATLSPTGKYGSNPPGSHANKMDAPSNTSSKGANGTHGNSSFSGVSKLHGSKHRYTQKNNCQLPGTASQTSGYAATNNRAGIGRSTVVTVKVGSSGHCLLKQNGTNSCSGTDSNGLVPGKKSTKSKLITEEQTDKQSAESVSSTSSVNSTGASVTKSETDWQELGAAVQDRQFTSKQLPSESLTSSDLV